MYGHISYSVNPNAVTMEHFCWSLVRDFQLIFQQSNLPIFTLILLDFVKWNINKVDLMSVISYRLTGDASHVTLLLRSFSLLAKCVAGGLTIVQCGAFLYAFFFADICELSPFSFITLLSTSYFSRLFDLLFAALMLIRTTIK